MDMAMDATIAMAMSGSLSGSESAPIGNILQRAYILFHIYADLGMMAKLVRVLAGSGLRWLTGGGWLVITDFCSGRA